eukprot:363419-Chlamydomonas_euryale.AAC.15
MTDCWRPNVTLNVHAGARVLVDRARGRQMGVVPWCIGHRLLDVHFRAGVELPGVAALHGFAWTAGRSVPAGMQPTIPRPAAARARASLRHPSSRGRNCAQFRLGRTPSATGGPERGAGLALLSVAMEEYHHVHVSSWLPLLLHAVARGLLLYKLLGERSCRGVSRVTQELIAVLYVARGIDMLWMFEGAGSEAVKAGHLVLAVGVVGVMRYSPKVLETYDADCDTVPHAFMLVPPFILALVFHKVCGAVAGKGGGAPRRNSMQRPPKCMDTVTFAVRLVVGSL